MNPQDPEGVPSHRCLILDQSFEALKSARSSTETMRTVQQEMQHTVNSEKEKNELYKKTASEYASFSEENDKIVHGMASLTNTSKENQNPERTVICKDEGKVETQISVDEDTWQIQWTNYRVDFAFIYVCISNSNPPANQALCEILSFHKK